MNKKHVIILLLILIIGCVQTKQYFQAKEKELKEEFYIQNNMSVNNSISKGEFLTEDNKTIAYSYYESQNTKFGIILLHMLDRTRQDFNDLAKLFQTAGYSVLAIDSRGHGESTKNWRWRAFSERDLRMMTLDVKGAVKFLQLKDINNTILIGASISANTALNYGITDNAVKAIVLMSPGLDYRGVKVEESASQNNKPTLVIASEDDLYAWTTSQQIFDRQYGHCSCFFTEMSKQDL